MKRFLSNPIRTTQLSASCFALAAFFAVLPAQAQDMSDKACARAESGAGAIGYTTSRVALNVGEVKFHTDARRFAATVKYRPRNDWCVISLSEGEYYWGGDDDKRLKCGDDKYTSVTGLVMSQATYGAATNVAPQIFRLGINTKRPKDSAHHSYSVFVFHNGPQIIAMCV